MNHLRFAFHVVGKAKVEGWSEQKWKVRRASRSERSAGVGVDWHGVVKERGWDKVPPRGQPPV
jgi:hypothetical protein